MLPNRRSQIVSKPLESGASVQGAGDRVATLINRGAPWLASMLADTQDALDAMTADRDRLYDQSLDHE